MRINTLSTDQVYAAIGTSADGIDSHEADARIRQFGYNEIRKVRKTPLIYRFLSQFTHFFAVMLWVAAGLAFLGEYLEPGQGMFHLGSFIIAVIFVNAVFTFVQEYRAERAAEALAKLLPSFVSAIRSGSVTKVNSRDIVPGDLIILSEGDKIPADARVIEQYGLRVNNAPLTGESKSVKRTADPAFEDEFVENPNLVFGGTGVAAGSGKAVVFATGASTEFGKIAQLTQTVLPEPTPLQREIHKVTDHRIDSGDHGDLFLHSRWYGGDSILGEIQFCDRDHRCQCSRGVASNSHALACDGQPADGKKECAYQKPEFG